MHVTGMTIAGLPPFSEPVEFDFDEHVNVFIGPNGVGKSTALRMLQSRSEIADRFAFQLSDDWVNHAQAVRLERQRKYWGLDEQNGSNPKASTLIVPWVYVPAIRTSLPASIDSDSMSALHAPSGAVEAYSEEDERWRWLPSLGLSAGQYSFDGSEIVRYCSQIAEMFRQGRVSRDQWLHGEFAKQIAYRCVQRICSEILPADREPTDYILRQPVSVQGIDHDYSVTTVFDNMGVATNDSQQSDLFAGDLSDGTQGTLLWIWYLALTITAFDPAFSLPEPYKSQWEARPRNWPHSWPPNSSVLMIDEIENHLHPTWQRRVIPALLAHFPGLQIFATTHSPFVVAGLKAGQVHLLKRDANGVVTASTNEHDIIGWTTDEILRTFMGVDEPTDQLTVDRANRLRELRGKQNPTQAEAEEMEELRRQVNEDFLSSSTPLEAQRERYGDMMLEFLRSRQSELSQDGN